ncbi:SH3 domain-containing protein [Elioraea sp. Yellowstone]|jgi:N-acetylmuramoyl-L-alanine amidase|uniref:N-acetylmuramoyl-L-alanine amidase n=1 Tax=Elioraea sp. Yellowstone TaxID=2592070 RepID=UPI001154836E|nr:N-acetylmuramoyl-L-alanine amidase [Elioraea sp. Yellowstone]TQF84842.1 SH3 domain-containing protein [Elioraea sp. Yellowstone]
MLEVKRNRLDGITFEESPHVGGRITPRFIVMHYTAGGSALSSVRAIRDRGLSAHLFVDRDGGIIQTVPFNVAAFHAGPSSWRGFDGLNRHAIGIEIANFGFLDRQTSEGWTRAGLRIFAPHEVMVAAHRNGGPVMAWELYPEAQLRALDAIVAALRAAYPTIQEVVGHDDISPGRKLDPGPAFPMARYQNQGGAAGSGTLRDDDLGAFEVTVRDSLNLRGGPGTGFAVLKSLAPGTRLRVLREAGEWRQVDLQGDGTPDGFVHGAFLRRIGA